LNKKTVLIVEDQPHVMRVIRLALERAGYCVVSAPNGEAAWQQIQAAHPDAMVTDIEMPRMSGRELCRRIALALPERSFPIIVMTSRPEIEHREWTRKMSRLVFLEKPLSLRSLVEVLNQQLAEEQIKEVTHDVRRSA
jgi:CheY-like chemotaxis protein